MIRENRENEAGTRDDLHGHIRSLHRYATGLVGNPTDAEDLVQESLRRVLDRMDRGATIRNLRAYLFQTLRNVHIDQRRQTSARWEDLDAEDANDEALSVRPDQEDRIRCADILEALAHLPAIQREVVLLVSLEGMSYQEVADLTDTAIGTVRSRLHRGRATLAALLDPDMETAHAKPAAAMKPHSIAGGDQP